MEKQLVQRKHRLVLVPCPYQGHINPMLQLAKALHSNGFSITIIHTVFNSPDPQNSHPDFSFIPLPEGLLDYTIAYRDVIKTVLIINENCKEIFKTCLQRLIGEEEQGNEVTRCVISDEFMFFAEDVANELKLSSVILRTTSALTSLVRFGLVKLNEQGLLPEEADSLSDEIVPELDPLRYKDLPFSLNHNFKTYSVLMTRVYGGRSSVATIWNTMNCLEQSILEKIQSQDQVPIFPVGPLHMIAPPISSSLIVEDRSCLSWLDKQSCSSVVYVSCLGSFGSLSEREVVEIAWGLAKSRQPFLWVVRPGSVRGLDWIEPLPGGFLDAVGERGCIVKWAPQNEVLAHSAVGGFWSHCGWNSTLESLAQGVPLICRPCFSDQKVNSRYLSHVWRVGLELEELERGVVERAIRRLILHDEGREMRARAKTFKHKIQASTRKGGSSRESFDELVKFILSR